MRQIYKPLLGLLTALLSHIPTLAYDFYAPNADGVTLYYYITSYTDKTVEVADYHKSGVTYIGPGYTGAVAIPEETTYNGTAYTVTAIGDHAFRGNDRLTSVTIPNSVTSIGDEAFEGCSSLTSVTIPNSVTSIGDEAFYGCSGLTSVTIPNSVTSIGDGAFSYCSNLSAFYGRFASDDNRSLNVDGKLIAVVPNGVTSYSIPSSVTAIGASAFGGCSGLTSVTIPNSVTSIGASAFGGCSGLTSVTIPNSVTSIGASAFGGCSSLTSVTIPNSVTTIGEYAFRSCTGLTSATIGNSVTAIDRYTFSDCANLTSVTIGSSVTRIEGYAFKNCSKLTSARFQSPSSITHIDSWAFNDCINLVKYTLSEINTTSITVNRTRNGVSGAAKACVYQYPNYYEDAVKILTLSPNKEFTVPYGFKVNDCFTQIGHLSGKTDDIWMSLGVTALSPTTALLQYRSNLYGATFKKAEISQYGEVGDGSGDVIVTGLNPNATSVFVYTITVEEGDYSRSYRKEVKTPALTFSTLPARVVNPGEVVVCAESNLDDAERNVGFEWRKVDAPSTVPSKEGAAVLYGGVMEGHIKGLSTSDFYNFRPYYESASGKRQYGEWMGFDPSDFSYFEPTLHTYAASSVTHSSATMCGMAVPGTDGIAEQGFEYWPATAPSAAPAAGETSGHSTVKAEGLYMEATVEGLLPETAYTYRSYVKTDAGATVYGEEMEFTTLADPQAGIGIVTADGVETEVTVEGYYDLNGRRHDEPRRGFNIVRYSDGSTRKLMVR